MARKSVISKITKVEDTKDITKIPELPIISSPNKLTAELKDEFELGKEEGEKDDVVVMASALPQTFSNSSLVNYTKLSPNCTSPRNHVIDTITIHCMAGNLTVETCGNVFASTSRQASSNYGVGSDGRIGLYVNESDRSWCTSNRDNDMRAITIEVANDGGQVDNKDSALNWHVSDAAMKSLINLVADICKRNKITSLKWQNNKALIGQVDKQNMTVHRWFAAKSCPGGYLMSKMSYIAESVNKQLGLSPVTPSPSTPVTPSTKDLYRIRKSWEDSKSQIGAYSILANAIAKAKGSGSDYKVYDKDGKQVYPEVSSTEELYRVRTSWDNAKSQVGAYKNKDNAIKIAKEKGSEYKVFNSAGVLVYPVVVSSSLKLSPKKESNGPMKCAERPDYKKGSQYKALVDFQVHMYSGSFSHVKLNKHFTNDTEAKDASEPAVFKAGKVLTAQRLSFFDNGEWWMESELGWVKIWDEETHQALFI